MTVNFYNVTDDPRVLQKTLGSVIYHRDNVNILRSCNIKTPELILQYDSKLIGVNYMEIVEWDRYYFVNEPVLSPGGRCVITGVEDVLMSNANDILNLNAYCSRCESKFERYAVDESILSLVTPNITTIPFDQAPFSADGTQRQFLLTVKGGSLS